MRRLPWVRRSSAALALCVAGWLARYGRGLHPWGISKSFMWRQTKSLWMSLLDLFTKNNVRLIWRGKEQCKTCWGTEMQNKPPHYFHVPFLPLPSMFYWSNSDGVKGQSARQEHTVGNRCHHGRLPADCRTQHILYVHREMKLSE